MRPSEGAGDVVVMALVLECSSARSARWSAVCSGEVTHHAAGTTQVHVATGHEPGGRCSADHVASLRLRTPRPQTPISCSETRVKNADTPVGSGRAPRGAP